MGYVKLWNDTKRNILAYVSAMHGDSMFFIRDAEIIRVNENIIYEYGTRKLICDNKNIMLDGFDIVSLIDEIEPELLPPIFALLCYKLV